MDNGTLGQSISITGMYINKNIKRISAIFSSINNNKCNELIVQLLQD